MKRKNGFTLVELLGVIAILALVVVVAAPPIINQIKKTRNTFDKATLNLIYSAADIFVDNNQNDYPNVNGNTYCVSLEELIKSGELKESIIDIDRENEIPEDQIVKIIVDNDLYDYSLVEANQCEEYSEPAYPELSAGMIPVIYNGTNWIKADAKDKWYDYNAKEWANAVTVTSTNRATYINAPAGTIIPMSDINTMWVWIPRYKYAIPAGTGARSINILFETKDATKSTGNAVDTNYLTHPAFTFGTTEVSGIWVGKFETTGTIASPTILPNTSALRSQTIKAMYDASRAMQNNIIYGFGTDGDIHMAKDSEWGAITYLSNSRYGINSEIYKNNSSSYYTGRSGGNVGGSQVKVGSNEYINTGFYTYDGKCATTTTLAPGIASECTAIDNNLTDKTIAYKASTTGNIYGVYDMSGGAYEYTMSMYRPTDSTSVTDSSGFGATTTTGTLPTSEYWNRYTTPTVTTACSGGICYGSALSETSGWYSDSAGFVKDTNPWSIRGGGYSNTTVAGAFYFSYSTGSLSSVYSFRLVQMKP